MSPGLSPSSRTLPCPFWEVHGRSASVLAPATHAPASIPPAGLSSHPVPRAHLCSQHFSPPASAADQLSAWLCLLGSPASRSPWMRAPCFSCGPLLPPSSFCLFSLGGGRYWATLGDDQGLLLGLSFEITPNGLRGLYRMLGVEPRCATCQAKCLTPVLSPAPPPSFCQTLPALLACASSEGGL